MTAHIAYTDANAWLEATKLTLTSQSFDTVLEDQLSTQMLSRLARTFDTTGWTDYTATPKLIKSLIAMNYAAAVYDRAYGDTNDSEYSNYAAMLRRMVEANVAGLLSGSIELLEDPDANNWSDTPAFYPTDLSSTPDLGFDDADPSAGPPSFMMGQVF